jgi:hypothetical protein
VAVSDGVAPAAADDAVADTDTDADAATAEADVVTGVGEGCSPASFNVNRIAFVEFRNRSRLS